MTTVPDPAVLTLGHSSHSLRYLVDLLAANAITAVADVRSVPYSRAASEMNRHSLASGLRAASIEYVFMGDELGGRSKYVEDYDGDGRVRYHRMASSPTFQRAIDRISVGAAKHRIALLCAEKDPLDCHRTLLVGRALVQRGIRLSHIHADGSLETDEDAMQRLLRLHDMQELSLFEPYETLIARACDLQAKRIAYVDKDLKAAAPSSP